MLWKKRTSLRKRRYPSKSLYGMIPRFRGRLQNFVQPRFVHVPGTHERLQTRSEFAHAHLIHSLLLWETRNVVRRISQTRHVMLISPGAA